jgi:hypothetical protein
MNGSVRSAAHGSGLVRGHRIAALFVACVCGLGGCSNDPGSMTKSEVEAKLKKETKLQEITLQERPEGGYEGTGRRADGVTYTLTVTQKKEEQSLSYVLKNDATKEMTAGSFRHFGPKWARTLDQGFKSTKLALLVLALLVGIVWVGVLLVRRSRA